MIVKFINPTAVRYDSMSTQTTPIKDGIKSMIKSTGDAPAQERGTQGAGGQPPLIEILSDLINAREELEGIYNTVKRTMAYTQNDAMYATLEEARKALINVIQLMNQAIDLASPYEVVET